MTPGAFGLSVTNNSNSPIHVSARLWNNAFHKNVDEGFAVRIGLPDCLRDNQLEILERYGLSCRRHLDVPMTRAMPTLCKLEIACVYVVLTHLVCASF
jgi:hypothetical protein